MIHFFVQKRAETIFNAIYEKNRIKIQTYKHRNKERNTNKRNINNERNTNKRKKQRKKHANKNKQKKETRKQNKATWYQSRNGKTLMPTHGN